MEQNTSKTATNTLIILAIIIISLSVFSSLSKESLSKQDNNNQENSELSKKTENTEAIEIVEKETATSTLSALATTTPLTSKKWTLVKTAAKSKDTTPKKTNAFTMTFTSDKKINGTTDCNSFFGTYKEELSKISFGPLGTTMMYCKGSEDQAFLKTLQNVSAFSFDKDNNLTLISASGTLLFK